MAQSKLIGPFRQLLTMRDIPAKGPLKDTSLEIIENAGILINGKNIEKIAPFNKLTSQTVQIEELQEPCIGMPGFIDPHTHICWNGTREKDYAWRLEGKTYEQIAQDGGGIWDTVIHTRNADKKSLLQKTVERSQMLLKTGTTTIETKSGYGLSVEAELKILHVIKEANELVQAELIPTCLAAHVKPKDFSGTKKEYLNYLTVELLPQLKHENLTKRIDIFVEESAFDPIVALDYLMKAKELGFDTTVHADQFTVGGSEIAVQIGAHSADHLEASRENEIALLANNSTAAVVLPGASIGLGIPFAPARKILDAGACLAIGSDWNPGSAPMGDLLIQAATLGMFEKLSMAETLAGITIRSAYALNLKHLGSLEYGKQADFIGFKLDNYKEILYNQGRIKPAYVWKCGKKIH